MKTREMAQNAAAAILSRRMYTCREVFDRLLKKGYDKDMAEEVIGDFVAAGYLDDRLYASMYVDDAIRLGAKGIYRIRQELIKKGVAASIIQEVLSQNDADTEDALKEYVESHNLQSTVHTRRDLEKLKARLARRGYSPGEINRCLSEYNFKFEETDGYDA